MDISLKYFAETHWSEVFPIWHVLTMLVGTWGSRTILRYQFGLNSIIEKKKSISMGGSKNRINFFGY